jgi:methylmalonyl-CoA mutase cobalamin-binding domain/chain
MSQEIRKAIIELKRDEITSLVKARLERGEDPLQVLDECREGMNAVGDLYQEGDYFLAELMLSAEVFKAAVAILEPHLARIRPPELLGRVLLATPKGDIHDLGKNIFATMLEAQGFEIVDMGVDVSPNLVLAKVKETRPDFVGFSTLISTTFDSMKEAVDMLEANDLRNRLAIMVGGGVTNSTVKDYVGADFQTVDATEGVRYCMNMVEGKRR